MKARSVECAAGDAARYASRAGTERFDTLTERRLWALFREIYQTHSATFSSRKSRAVLLIICTVVSLLLANSVIGANYLSISQLYVGGLSVEHWINDALMAVFFLLIGLELERELYNGELSNFKNALLPIAAAIGGICLPALIHLVFNSGTPTQAGIGIPMATDIAFALGVLALLGNRVPASLKVFLTALAVMDDLGAIIIIAVFYTAQLSLVYVIGALAVLGLLVALNRFRVMSLMPYLFRRRGHVVLDVEIWRSCDDCRSLACIYDSVYTQGGR